MDQVSHLLSHPLSSWVSTDSYTLDQDIIASREALQYTAKAMGSENSLRSTSRRAENMNMARQHYQQQDQTVPVSSSRPELHQSAFISAAGLSGGDGASPYNAPYMGAGHYTDIQQQQQHQLQNTYYTTAPTYNTMTAASTPVQEQCYPSYPSLQLPSINNMYEPFQYPNHSNSNNHNNNYTYDLQPQQHHQTYYTDDNDLYETDSRPFFDYNNYNTYIDTYPPPMDADQTAFSTPDVLTNQRFPEPKTPPPPATAAAKAFDPVASQGGDDLVGLGLYDEPMSSSLFEEHVGGGDGGFEGLYHASRSAGLKLEETFDPETLEMDLEEDDDD